MLLISLISNIPGLFISLHTMPDCVPIRQPTNGFGAVLMDKTGWLPPMHSRLLVIASAFDLSGPKCVNSQTGNQQFSV